jgi:hypothetical protein
MYCPERARVVTAAAQHGGGDLRNPREQPMSAAAATRIRKQRLRLNAEL